MSGHYTVKSMDILHTIMFDNKGKDKLAKFVQYGAKLIAISSNDVSSFSSKVLKKKDTKQSEKINFIESVDSVSSSTSSSESSSDNEDSATTTGITVIDDKQHLKRNITATTTVTTNIISHSRSQAYKLKDPNLILLDNTLFTIISYLQIHLCRFLFNTLKSIPNRLDGIIKGLSLYRHFHRVGKSLDMLLKMKKHWFLCLKQASLSPETSLDTILLLTLTNEAQSRKFLSFFFSVKLLLLFMQFYQYINDEIHLVFKLHILDNDKIDKFAYINSKIAWQINITSDLIVCYSEYLNHTKSFDIIPINLYLTIFKLCNDFCYCWLDIDLFGHANPKKREYLMDLFAFASAGIGLYQWIEAIN